MPGDPPSAEMKMNMSTYRFWVGNDAVHFSVRVKACSPEEALRIIGQCFDGLTSLYPYRDATGVDQIEEAEVVLSTGNMSVEDIIEVEPVE